MQKSIIDACSNDQLQMEDRWLSLCTLVLRLKSCLIHTILMLIECQGIAFLMIIIMVLVLLSLDHPLTYHIAAT